MSDSAIRTATVKPFEYQGKPYTISIEPNSRAVNGVRATIKNEAGDEAGRIDYIITVPLQEKWDLSDRESEKFLTRFAQFHARIRVAKGGLFGVDEYFMDIDFASSAPEKVIEKVEREWGSIG
jgi:hypothetical protein